MDTLLKLMETNAHLTPSQLAVMCDMKAEEIESKIKETREQRITEYKNYILKHWKGILNMQHSLCKSSMKSHIEHCMAPASSVFKWHFYF